MNRRTFVQSSALAALAMPRGFARGLSVLADLNDASQENAPLHWVPPATFSLHAPNLGLPVLDGVTNQAIYDPMPSHAPEDEGGSGRYEDLLHGTFNHHPEILTHQGHCIVTWTNHSNDENGPGGRMLARHGEFRCGQDEIDWGGSGNVVELAPPAVPVRRRPLKNDTGQIYEVYPLGRLTVINDRLYFIGHLVANHGWTNSPLYRHPTDLEARGPGQPAIMAKPSAPIPEDSWSNAQDRKRKFDYDVWWELGLPFIQEWQFKQGKLTPTSPIYKMGEFHGTVRITESITETVHPIGAPYTDAVDFKQAPEQLRNDILHGRQLFAPQVPKYAPGTETLAADGKNSLAHHSEFVRPDGTYVIVRDNLVNPGYYYAAAKKHKDDVYPKAILTNLYGSAMPACGALPDGSPYILCNSPNRNYMYLTISRDGMVFDKTWMILYVHGLNYGGHFQTGGPAYFKTLTVGQNLWAAYSISKEQIGVSRMPIAYMRNL